MKKAKPADKDYKLSDAGGLHLLVTPSGGKLWRLAYRFNGKQKTLAFGAYPALSLRSDAYILAMLSPKDEADGLTNTVLSIP